jgi:isopenicillin N synthase-like dioxygenase
MAPGTVVDNCSSKEATLAEARSAQNYLQSRLTATSAATAPAFRSIPIIDIGPSFSSSFEARQSVAKEINAACTTSGFFYIKNHGVPQTTCDQTLKLAERFFKELPKDKKEDIHMKKSSIFRGWEPSEHTMVNPDDWKMKDYGAGEVKETKEGFNWGYEEALDPTGGDGKYTELDGTRDVGNLWPGEEDLPGFFEGIKAYYGQVRGLLPTRPLPPRSHANANIK